MLITAEYPYFRDTPEVWADRLRTLVAATGIRVITTYVPWRFHQPAADREPDLSAATDFVRLCGRLGLDVIVKPGPFIHAETNYGGLPDWVSPLEDASIEPQLDSAGRTVRWSGSRLDRDGRAEPWPLPAPLCPRFSVLAREWLRAAGRELLTAELLAPNGPVVAVQIGNEGLFTNGSRPLDDYDYSPSGLAFFRNGLARHYGDLDAYNRHHGTSVRFWTEIDPPRAGSPGTPAACADWGRFHADYLHHVLRDWADAFGSPVPVLLNLNPPAGEDGAMDAWLARVRPEQWTGMEYGFTNWMGVVSADRGAHARYVVAAKRAPGPNMEENWGFSKLYDEAYASAATSFHQTLLALAAGATGFNVYTAVGTGDWTPALDVVHSSPYPDCAPIDEDGRVTAKAATVRMLAEFFTLHGREFQECVPVTAATWGLYTPYAAVAAWDPQAAEQCGRPLLAFHERSRAEGWDYRIVDLEHADLSGHDQVALHGGAFMHRHVQHKLAAHLRAGGRVDLEGLVPLLDEHHQPCTMLAEALRDTGQPDREVPRAVRVVEGIADAYLRSHPSADVHYLTVLAQSDSGPHVVVEIEHRGRTQRVELTIAAGGAAILRLAAGELGDFLVTGINGHLGSAVAAACRVDGTGAAASQPADLLRVGGRTTQEETTP
ncbi:hypothetical protein Aph01nite_31810 [Acrocarpospora phusangensis]|uniref:Glycoside hydrolase 35 catalytic domain-containing protein n=1 Tax=Acrocarpospora phusangensis TaxID=1070424 RepID=A0A919UKC9_9ACTN|nr:beta-galactosidase [Acrocarpospora phusangensis]GIH24871.1 hypothetical protein Aph01nite_31810 [Acrocarpospora phusangensis]